MIRQINFVKTIYSDPVHAHKDSFEFHFCISGECFFNTEKHMYTFKPGILAFVQPGVSHQMILKPDTGQVSFYYIIFSIDAACADLNTLLEKRFEEMPYCNVSVNYNQLFEKIKMLYNSSSSIKHSAARHLFLGFLYELIELRQAKVKKSSRELVEKVIQIMKNKLTAQLQLDTIADELGYNKSYLIRVFKQEMEIPPLQYFHRLKIETALYLLQQQHMSVGEISEYLGFYDQFHFSRVFKKYTGSSPLTFR